MSGLEKEVVDAELAENKKIDDANTTAEKIADRQKTLESIGFYNAVSYQGKHALGYAAAVMKARADANEEIRSKYYAGDQEAFERFKADSVEKETSELFNAEAHERTQLVRYRQEADKAELISAKEKLSDSVTGRIGAVADASVAKIAIANKVVEDSMKAVKSAESDLAAAEEALKDAAKNGDIVDPGVIDAYKNTLESANRTLEEALLTQAAASVDQDSSLSKEFTAAYAQISDESKKWFARRYNELLQYGYNEDMAYVIASSDASNLSMGAIEDLIANGNREAADSILDMMDGVKPKLNSETGEYEIDRSKRGYMSAGDIYKFKNIIKGQRDNDLAEKKKAIQEIELSLAPSIEKMEYVARTQDVKDEDLRRFCEGLRDKGHTNWSSVYAKLDSIKKTRDATKYDVDIEAFTYKTQTNDSVTDKDIRDFCEDMRVKGYTESGRLYSRLKGILDDKVRIKGLANNADAEEQTAKMSGFVKRHLEDCRRNVSRLVTDAAAGKDGSSEEMYQKAQEGMMWLEKAVIDGLIKDAQAKVYRDIFSPQIIAHRATVIERAFRKIGIKYDSSEKVNREKIADEDGNSYEEEKYSALQEVFFSESGNGFDLSRDYSKAGTGGYFIPVGRSKGWFSDGDFQGFYLTPKEMEDILDRAGKYVDAYHGGKNEGDTQVTLEKAITSAIETIKKEATWKNRRAKAVDTIIQALDAGLIVTAERRLRASVDKHVDEFSKKDNQ